MSTRPKSSGPYPGEKHDPYPLATKAIQPFNPVASRFPCLGNPILTHTETVFRASNPFDWGQACTRKLTWAPIFRSSFCTHFLAVLRFRALSFGRKSAKKWVGGPFGFPSKIITKGYQLQKRQTHIHGLQRNGRVVLLVSFKHPPKRGCGRQ